jgi:hypothetical protein
MFRGNDPDATVSRDVHFDRAKVSAAYLMTKAVEHRRTLKRFAQNDLIRLNASAFDVLTF